MKNEVKQKMHVEPAKFSPHHNNMKPRRVFEVHSATRFGFVSGNLASDAVRSVTKVCVRGCSPHARGVF
jgi:hypothetical protein